MDNCYRYKTYPALMLRLKRRGLAKPGALASTLLFCFLYNKGKIYKSLLVEKGIISSENNFNTWRDEMIRLRVIQYKSNTDGSNLTLGLFEPGYEIVALIQKEKMLTGQGVPKFSNPEKYYEQIIWRLIEKLDPPCSKAKVLRYIQDCLPPIEKEEIDDEFDGI